MLSVFLKSLQNKPCARITELIQENERYCYFVPYVPHPRPAPFLEVSASQHYYCLGLDSCRCRRLSCAL